MRTLLHMNLPDDMRRRGEMLISSMEFDDLLRKETQTLSGFVPTLGREELQPMIIALLEGTEPDGTRKRTLLPVQGLTEDANKQEIMIAIGTAAAESGLRLVGAFLISEAWVKKLNPAEAWRMKSEPVQPSKTVDREETLIVWGRTVDRRVALAMAPIQRNDAGTRLGEWTITNCQPAGEQDQDNLLSFFFLGFLIGWGRRD